MSCSLCLISILQLLLLLDYSTTTAAPVRVITTCKIFMVIIKAST